MKRDLWCYENAHDQPKPIGIVAESGAGEGEGDGGAAGASAVSTERKPAKPRALSARELQERALLAMCIADPKSGRRFIDELTEEHISPSGGLGLRWLRDHLEEPMAGLPREEPELVSLVTELVMRAESEPASEPAMQLNFDLLEQQRLEDGISAAQKAGDYVVSSRLSQERAALTDRIAHAGVVS